MKYKLWCWILLATIVLLIRCKQADKGAASHHQNGPQTVQLKQESGKKIQDYLQSQKVNAVEVNSNQSFSAKVNRRKGTTRASTIKLGKDWQAEATPVIVNGIMYLSGACSIVNAIDLSNGKLLWTYDPKVPGRFGEKTSCDVENWGVALYKGLLYFETVDGRLVALDAANGQLKWETLTVDTLKTHTILGAPKVMDGNVIVGTGGGADKATGYITAYDAVTGKQAWRFYTTNGLHTQFENEAFNTANISWNNKWWETGGEDAEMDALAIAPALRYLYLKTGRKFSESQPYHSKNTDMSSYFIPLLPVNTSSNK